MLTDKCKKHLKKLLKGRYNIECYRIVEAQQNAYNYFYYTLICVCENKGFEMLLTISRQMRYPTTLRTHVALANIQPDIEADDFIDDYDFTLSIESKDIELVKILNDYIHDNPVVHSMNTVNKKFSLGIDSKLYLLYTKVIPVMGVLKKEKGWFNVKTVSEHSYLTGNLCSTFFNEKRDKQIRAVLFNFFVFGDKFNYITAKKAAISDAHVNDELIPFNTSSLTQFENVSFHELFFTYSDLFNFNIEDMSKQELCELDIDDFVKYIEVQKMIQI